LLSRLHLPATVSCDMVTVLQTIAIVNATEVGRDSITFPRAARVLLRLASESGAHQHSLCAFDGAVGTQQACYRCLKVW
jgi:hypothetical protein